MKRLSVLFAMLLFATYSFAQVDPSSDKTLIKTLDPAGSEAINVDFKHKSIQASSWDNGTIRIQLEVRSNMPEAILSQLVKAGRYTLNGTLTGNQYVITAPNLGKEVTIGGKSLEETILVHINTPGYFKVEGQILRKHIDEQTIASLTARGETAKLNDMRKIKEKVDIEVKLVTTSKADKIKKNNKGGDKDMTPQQLKALYGEVLIDGVIFEIE